jgi:hypothetical protein
MTCCIWEHVRPCGPIVVLDLHPLPFDEANELCACGCSASDERCGGGEWWGSGEPFFVFMVGVVRPFYRWLERQPEQTHRSILRMVRTRGLRYKPKHGWVVG